jgi:hypothetical protein
MNVAYDTTPRRNAMSYEQTKQEIEGLRMAGWDKDQTGLWKHHHVNGLHNLKSAIAITDRWAREGDCEPESQRQ